MARVSSRFANYGDERTAMAVRTEVKLQGASSFARRDCEAPYVGRQSHQSGRVERRARAPDTRAYTEWAVLGRSERLAERTARDQYDKTNCLNDAVGCLMRGALEAFCAGCDHTSPVAPTASALQFSGSGARLEADACASTQFARSQDMCPSAMMSVAKCHVQKTRGSLTHLQWHRAILLDLSQRPSPFSHSEKSSRLH